MTRLAALTLAALGLTAATAAAEPAPRLIDGADAWLVAAELRVAPADQQRLAELTEATARDTVRTAPGFRAAIVLVSLDGSHLFLYEQWDSEAAHRGHLADAAFQARRAAAEPLILAAEARGYRLAFTYGEESAFVPGGDGVFLINVFRTEPAQQAMLVDALATRIDPIMRGQPGYRSTHFHAAADGTRVVNISAWRSADDYAAAERSINARMRDGAPAGGDPDPRFASDSRANIEPFMAIVGRMVSQVEPRLYRVHSVTRAVPR
jgi:quinol monooxygenase YgiN